MRPYFGHLSLQPLQGPKGVLQVHDQHARSKLEGCFWIQNVRFDEGTNFDEVILSYGCRSEPQGKRFTRGCELARLKRLLLRFPHSEQSEAMRLLLYVVTSGSRSQVAIWPTAKAIAFLKSLLQGLQLLLIMFC